jgi:hypothetical protein
MFRRLCRWLAPLVVMALWAAAVRAAGAAADTGDSESPPHVPVLGSFLAFVFTVLALVIVCMPSRKST